jgi:hypothetical protein
LNVAIRIAKLDPVDFDAQSIVVKSMITDSDRYETLTEFLKLVAISKLTKNPHHRQVT